MFRVLSEGPFVREIGSANPIGNGFKVTIDEGETFLVLKSKKFIGRFDIYELSEKKVIKKTGVGKQMDYAGNWVELNINQKKKIYIKVSKRPLNEAELDEVMAG